MSEIKTPSDGAGAGLLVQAGTYRIRTELGVSGLETAIPALLLRSAHEVPFRLRIAETHEAGVAWSVNNLPL